MKSKLFSTLLFGAIASLALLYILAQPAYAQGPDYHVDADAPCSTCDGLSWTTAFTDVQDALAVAADGNEIWVATGIYTPGATVSDTFQLVPGVAIYGGFAATETLRSQRDWVANPTVLSGDFGGDDITDANGVVTATANISGANSYHVVTGSGVTTTARLDGFTITAGQANGSGGNMNGGGMYNNDGSPTLADLRFSGNSAVFGGGMFNAGGSNPTLTGVSFSGNSAVFGGGMRNEGSNPILMGVSFSGNSVTDDGGGLDNRNNSNPILIGVSFSGNSANLGGGMHNYISNPKVTGVSFSGNSALVGGGIYNVNNSSPRLTNVSFSGNSADYGGGIGNGGSSPTLTNVSFSGNWASVQGGGMYNFSSHPQVYNSILWNNQDSSGTGTITATIYNDSSSITLTHSLVQSSGGSGSWITDTNYVDGGGNLDTDPWFAEPISPTAAPTTTGNLRLQVGSPAINAGDDQYITATTDLDGNPRIVNGTVDMGAYEGQELCFVEASGDNTTDYSSIDAGAVQWAVDAAAPGDVLKIAGSCTGVQVRAGLTQTVYISQNLALRGGYTTTNWLATPDPQTYTTTLDANDGGRVVEIPSGYQVTLAYLTIRGGNADKGSDLARLAWGGGIRNSGVLTVTNSEVISNVSGDWGGGLMNGGTARISKSSFHHNLGDTGSGLLNGGDIEISNSTIYANRTTSGSGSGGIHNRGVMTVSNSTVSGNQGIGIENYYDKVLTLRHTSIISNSEYGVKAYNGATTSMVNSIVAYNGLGDCGGGIFNDLGYNLVADGACINAGTSQSGDPLLVPLADNGSPVTGLWPAALTHALLAGSPALNHIPAGVSGCGTEFSHDQRGVTRPQFGQCDLGAYEHEAGALICPSGSQLFVDHKVTGFQDGSSWATAYADLQQTLTVITACGKGQEIWVATGVYTPGAIVSDTFQLVPGVAVYGGFAATETQRTQRDWVANPTVLSGDIAGDDTTDGDGVVTATANISGTNSYHVVFADGVTGTPITGTTTLDGFTITAGQANGSFPHEDGGGFYCDGYGNGSECSPSLSNVIFSGNLAGTGGAIYNSGGNGGNSSPNLNSTSFYHNYANNEGGGAMFNDSSNGGNSSPSLFNVTFSGNATSNSGGAMSTYGDAGTSLTLVNVAFFNNSANSDGGAMFNDSVSNLALTNVTFSGNAADDRGGGMYNYSSRLVQTNVTLSGNAATTDGGGMYNQDSNSSVYNSVLWNNQDSSGTGTITATIYTDNSTITLTHSLVQGTGGSGSWTTDIAYVDGGGNLDADPWFVAPISPTAAPTTSGNLRLQSLSPAIDAGDNQYTSVITDLDGNPRFMDGDWSIAATVDMGAFEHQPTCPTGPVVRVDQNAPTPGLGATWGTAFRKLQNALFATSSCSGVEEIWVATGVYTPGAAVSDTFQLLADLEIYGGFAATETLRTQRDWQANPTVLSGDIDGNDTTDADRVVTDTANITGTNSYHVVVGSGVTSTAVLDGFTITAGQANGSYSSPCVQQCGGGMYNNGGSPTLTNVAFSGNLAIHQGAGMSNFNGSHPILTNVTFSDNVANVGGGGMYNQFSNPVVTNATFSANSAGDGGGIGNYYGSPIVTNAIFAGNFVTYTGGGIYNWVLSNATLTNVVFSGNTAAYDGGGMYSYNSNPILTNASFSGNRAGNQGGGIYHNEGNLQVYNTILWNNQDSSGVGTITTTIFNDNSFITLTNSLIQGSGGSGAWIGGSYVDGGGNLDTDPWFVTPISPTTAPTTSGNLRLLSGSPAIDGGDNQYITATTDLDGNPRIADGDWSNTATVDMGAYEYQPLCPTGPAVRVNQNAPTPGLGETWASAVLGLQNGLAIAGGCSGITEIWVASGVYTPGASAEATFQLLDDVAIYGGFAATETLRTQRDWQANPAVLSGDIEGNDLTDADGVVTDTANITGTNSTHVVTGSGVTTTARLDGFTITAGQANGGGLDGYGGGMLNYGGSPTLAYLRFSGNSASSMGGGMLNWYDTGSPMLTNVSFSGNSANVYGGGMGNMTANPTLINVSFSDNSASRRGGGMVNRSNSSPTLSNVSFSGNRADIEGGGMYNNSSSPSLTDVSFSGNRAGTQGGGMYNYNQSSPRLTNVSFSGNQADTQGGGMYNYSSSPRLTNVSFSGNRADTQGGGMYNYNYSNPRLTNVSFSGNWAGTQGGGMYNDWYSTPQLYNSILWHNQDSSGLGTITATIANSNNSTISLTHSLAQGTGDSGGWVTGTTYLDGGGNLDTDPWFVEPISPTTAPTTSGNLRLLSGSPAIDTGDNQYITVTTDLDGNPRFQDGDADGTATVDMGAYEVPTHYRLTVGRTGNGTGQVSSDPVGIDCGVTCTLVLEQNSAITLTAAADSGSYFAGWSGDITSADNPLPITMDASKVITAAFSTAPLVTYTLTVNTVGSGSVSPESSSQISGTVLNLSAIPDSGWQFAGWSGDLGGADNPATITMDGDKMVTATFTTGAVVTYTLSVHIAPAGSGSVTRVPSATTYVSGTVVELTATPITGWQFTGWSGDLMGTANPATITMTQNRVITASFGLTDFHIYLPVVLRNR